MITSKTISKGIVRAVATLAIAALILYVLYLLSAVITYIILAIILSMMGTPIVRFLHNKLKFKNTLAVIVTLILFLGILAGFFFITVPLILDQGKNLSVLNVDQIEQKISLLLTQFKSFLENHNIDSSALMSETKLTGASSLNFIPAFINGILGTLSSFGVGLASVLFITFFFLKDRELFLSGFKTVLPDKHEEKILHSLDKIDRLLSRYFIGLLLQLTVIFVLYLIVLLIFGIPNALVIAFICAILNIIPYIGPMIGTVLAALLVMMSRLGQDFQSEILPVTLYVMLGFWIVQMIDNNFSGPLIFSNSVKSNPLEIFLIVLIAGFLFGVTGMIVAIPLYTMIKVILKEFIPDNTLIKLLTKDI